MKLLKLIRKETPSSIARQMKPEPKKHISRAKFETVDINGKLVKVNVRCLPDDLPTHSEWFKKRIWIDEIEGRALTC